MHRTASQEEAKVEEDPEPVGSLNVLYTAGNLNTFFSQTLLARLVSRRATLLDEANRPARVLTALLAGGNEWGERALQGGEIGRCRLAPGEKGSPRGDGSGRERAGDGNACALRTPTLTLPDILSVPPHCDLG